MTITEIISQPAIQAAPLLLGMSLLYDSPEGRVSGRIVEVEAYQSDDPASHSFKPMTARTAALFGPPGTIYIYFIYGKHHCLNVVLGNGRALLIRAIEPQTGIGLMKRRRNVGDIKQLCNGPAKLVQAFGIPRELNGTSFLSGPLRLEEGAQVPSEHIAAAPRIGITKATNKLWRFYIMGNKFVS